MTTVRIPLSHYMELVLRYHPYAIIEQGDEVWNALQSVPANERQSYVLENEEWTIGFNCEPIKSVAGLKNGWRVWHRSDWEICDNKRQEAVRRIDKAQQDYRDNMDMMRQTVKDSMAKTANMTPQIWEMMLASRVMNDTVIRDMYNTIMQNTTTTKG